MVSLLISLCPQECFYEQSDFVQVFPSMTAIQNLEIDTWITSSEPMPVPVQLSFPLVTLRLRVNICESQLIALLTSQGQVLEQLDLYFERTMGTDAMEAALLECAQTLRNVSYCYNPSQVRLAFSVNGGVDSRADVTS